MPWTEADDDFINKNNQEYWRKRLANQGELKAPPPRSLWGRFMDSIDESMRRGPASLIADVVAPLIETGDGKSYQERRKEFSAKERQRRIDYDAVHAPKTTGEYGADIAGGIVGSVISDPTNLVNPGGSLGRQIIGNAAVGGLGDAALQGGEIAADIRDEYDPLQGGINTVAGPVLISATAGGKKAIEAIARPKSGVTLDDAVGIGNKFGTVTSTVRSKARNKKVGGVPNSYHLSGQAIDIARGKGVTHKQIENAYRRAGFDIIESLDEGDHSHLAFNFKKSGKKGTGRPVMEDFDFRPPEQRGEVVDFPSEKRPELTEDELGDILSMRESGDIVEFRDPSDPYSGPEWDALEEANKRLKDGSITIEEYEAIRDKTLEDAGKPPVRNKSPQENMDDLLENYRLTQLTPAERQEMDASVPKPKHTPTTPKSLGKGSVATTPVNDTRDLDGLGEGPNFELISNRTGKPPTELYRIMSIDQYEAAKKAGKLTSNEGRVHAGDKPSYGYAEPGNKNVLIRIKGSEGFRPKWTLDKVEAIADEVPFDRIELVAKGTRDQLETTFNRQPDRSKPPTPPREPPMDNDGYSRGGPFSDGPTDSRTPTDKLWQALNEARPLNREQKRLYSEERSARLKKVFAARKTSQGEKGFFTELKQLKGDMPEVDFESIRDKFTQPEIDHLHDLIKNNPFFTGFDAINAREGLQKMLKGKLPTDSELVLLARAYPKQIIEALKKMRPWKKRVLEQVNNLVNLPRSIMSSFDISFGGRQGIFLIGRKNFWKAYSGTLKRISSEKEFQAMQREIAQRPSYELMKKGGLDLMDLHSLPSEREEAFMSAWGEKLPGVRHSSRAYIGYLNRLRADMFDDLTTKFVKQGIPLDDKLLRDVARYINTATGRGNLGSFSQAATVLSNILFSPRLLASRLNLLNLAFYANLEWPVAKEALRDLASFSGAAASVLGLASMVPGVEVNMDTTSSDFAKIKVGNTRLDVLGGFQQYIKLGFQLAKGEKTNSRGEKVKFNDPKKYAGTTYATAVLDFLRSKLSPSAGYAVDAAHGKNIVGEPFDLKKDTLELFIPLWMQDAYDAVQEHGKVGALAGIPAILGVGVQTYKPRSVKEKSKKEYPSDDFEKEFKSSNSEDLDKWFNQ